MLIEPDLDRAVLAAALRRDYGLAASAVRFLPVGETAWCYQVIDEQGGRWFVKLGRPGAIEPARAEFALQLARVLAELGLPVPRPQATQGGAWWCWLGGQRLALFEFIDGEPLSDHDLSAAGLTERVGGLAAGVHGATGTLGMPVLFTETFEVWADGLRRCLAELEPGAGRADGLVAEARALVWPQRAALLDMQQRVQALGNAAGSQPRERVLCHGDLRGDNLLGDRAGRVWLVDWDGAVMAPRERDLAGFAGRGFGRFLAGTGASPAVASTSTRTWSRSSCCAATSRTWSTGWAACSAMISPSSSDSRTSTGCGGACRAGRRWRPASSGPVGCWHGGDAAREPVLVGARWPAWSTGRVDT